MKGTCDMNELFKRTGNNYLIDYCKRLGLNTDVSNEWLNRVGKTVAIQSYVNAVFVRVCINKELSK